MTDFYKAKKKAIEIIDGLVEGGNCTRAEIVLSVERATGLSKRVTNGFINDNIKQGKFVENEDFLVVLNQRGVCDENKRESGEAGGYRLEPSS